MRNLSDEDILHPLKELTKHESTSTATQEPIPDGQLGEQYAPDFIVDGGEGERVDEGEGGSESE